MAIDREGNLYDPCGGEPVVDNTTQPKVKKMGFTFDELEKVLQEQQYQQNLSRYGLKDGENVDIPIYTDFIEASQKIGLYHIPINVEYDMENTVMQALSNAFIGYDVPIVFVHKDDGNYMLIKPVDRDIYKCIQEKIFDGLSTPKGKSRKYNISKEQLKNLKDLLKKINPVTRIC